MPNSKSHRRGQEEKNRKGKLAEKASSFHGRSGGAMGEQLIRPRTVPELLVSKSVVGGGVVAEGRPLKLTKLLLNVTIQRSLGAVQVIMSPESTVGDLIAAAMRQYVKEGRRPILSSTDSSSYGLHYSQFSLESLDRDERLMELGSRNFFLCPTSGGGGSSSSGSSGSVECGVATSSTSCSKQAEKATKIGLPWLKFF
ncbi:uncharacterized protein LOC114272384 [Camellia sinensis]|uniref:DUF7054 domain-containing protein n=1 Tax=Camellia sinensis var. sinensis TaxID=542762 RepID=A0A4S4EF11_CAMSN|nr:uncharacterized protein LOC114272384 [Camellia sinensis]THG14504.1 hypothetical protein TEA_029623 [Camellia sinensis var. sinensis]